MTDVQDGLLPECPRPSSDTAEDGPKFPSTTTEDTVPMVFWMSSAGTAKDANPSDTVSHGAAGSAVAVRRGRGVVAVEELVQQSSGVVGRRGELRQLVLGRAGVRAQVLPVSADSYQARWIETTFTDQGQVKNRATWTATFTVKQEPNVPAGMELVNPGGLFITDFNWNSDLATP